MIANKINILSKKYKKEVLIMKKSKILSGLILSSLMCVNISVTNAEGSGMGDSWHKSANTNLLFGGENLPGSEPGFTNIAKDHYLFLYDAKKDNYAEAKALQQKYLNNWGAGIGTGKVEANNGQLVTGGTVYKAVTDTVTNKVNEAFKNNSGTITETVKNTVNDAMKQQDSKINAKADQTTVDAELAKKANTDASNLAGHEAQWGTALGKGTVAQGDNKLVTGDTVNKALQSQNTQINQKLDTKADSSTVNAELAKKANTDASNLAGQETKWGTALGKGTVTQGNGQLVTGNTVYQAMQQQNANVNKQLDTKANIDASNLKGHEEQWGAALGTGKVNKGDGKLVTGDTVYQALQQQGADIDKKLDTKADKDTVNAELAKKANVDASNLKGHEEQWGTALGTGSISKDDNKLVSGKTVYQAMQQQGVDIDKKLDTKANVDGSNLKGHEKQWGSAIGTGKIEANNGELVTGNTVYQVTVNKANTDMDNLTEKGKDVIYNISKDSVKVVNGNHTTVTTTTNGKTTNYAVNVTTDGKIEKGNTGIVTGDTVYQTTINKANTDMDNLTEKGKDVIYNISKDSVKVVDGNHTTVTTTTNGKTTNYAVNVTTDGKVEKGNTGVVSGDTVYNAVTNVQQNVINYDNRSYSSVTMWGKNGTVIHNVADGEISATSKDAVNGSQLYNATSNLHSELNSLSKESKQGDALNAALSAMKPSGFDGTNQDQLMAGIGTYKGETALALGYAHYDVTGGGALYNIGLSTNGEDVMVNAGASWAIGSRTKVAAPQDKVDEMRQQIDDLENRIQHLQTLTQATNATKNTLSKYDKVFIK